MDIQTNKIPLHGIEAGVIDALITRGIMEL
jgi:hypothetical protein